jgi:hypothetical protein
MGKRLVDPADCDYASAACFIFVLLPLPASSSHRAINRQKHRRSFTPSAQMLLQIEALLR